MLKEIAVSSQMVKLQEQIRRHQGSIITITPAALRDLIHGVEITVASHYGIMMGEGIADVICDYLGIKE